MKKLPLTLASYLLAGLPLVGDTVNSTLTVTPTPAASPDPEYNVIELELSPPVLPTGRDKTELTGTLEIELEIDPATDQVSQFTIVNGTATGSPIDLSGSTPFVGSYDFTSSELGADLSTPSPPGVVDPATGNFNAADHSLTVNSGTLSGSISVPLLGINDVVDFDFAALPFGGTGSGDGTVLLTVINETPTQKDYDVVVLFPINIEDTIDAMGVLIPVAASGIVRAVGTATLPLTPADPFVAWTESNGIPGALPTDDINGDGVMNGLQWALGLDAASNPFPHLLKPIGDTGSSIDFSLSLPEGGSAFPITVFTATDPMLPFNPLASGSVSTGNPIPQGTTGAVTISLPKNARGFVQLVVGTGGN